MKRIYKKRATIIALTTIALFTLFIPVVRINKYYLSTDETWALSSEKIIVLYYEYPYLTIAIRHQTPFSCTGYSYEYIVYRPLVC